MVAYVAAEYGEVYAEGLSRRLAIGVEGLRRMPARWARLRPSRGSRFEYQRILIGRHRIIFYIDEPNHRVIVVRIDLQRTDPARLGDLP